MLAARILFLARTSRWAIVASGTRKARAISGVCRPAISRRVSATWAVRGERRVAAGEDQPEPVVGHGSDLLGFVGFVHGAAASAWRSSRVDSAAEPVDRPVAGGGDDPAGGAGRQAVGRPPLEGDDERLLDRLLGDVDVAEEADQGGDRSAGLAAEDPLDLGGVHGRRSSGRLGSSWNGRTSTGPWQAAAGLGRPSSRAASRSGALMTQKPPICSLASANGPSVIDDVAAWCRRRRSRCRRARRPPPNTHWPASLDLGVERVDVLEGRLHLFLGSVGVARPRRVDGEQVLGHVGFSSVVARPRCRLTSYTNGSEPRSTGPRKSCHTPFVP